MKEGAAILIQSSAWSSGKGHSQGFELGSELELEPPASWTSGSFLRIKWLWSRKVGGMFEAKSKKHLIFQLYYSFFFFLVTNTCSSQSFPTCSWLLSHWEVGYIVDTSNQMSLGGWHRNLSHVYHNEAAPHLHTLI